MVRKVRESPYICLSVCVCERESERERELCVCEREGARKDVWVCVCVWEREREGDRERVWVFLHPLQFVIIILEMFLLNKAAKQRPDANLKFKFLNLS